MKTKKITIEEITPISISSLPTRPTASTAFGGKGMTSTEMKEAFDKLPLLAIERLNELIDDITSGRINESIPVTGTAKLSNMLELMEGIENGELASAIKVFGSSLTITVGTILADIKKIKIRMGIED